MGAEGITEKRKNWPGIRKRNPGIRKKARVGAIFAQYFWIKDQYG
jgi:hypothetical protein